MDIVENKKEYNVQRPVYSYKKLKSEYEEHVPNLGIIQSLKANVNAPKLTLKSVLQTVFPFPFILWSFYSWRNLLSDIIAGFTLLIFHIPQGMAYGLLSGLKPINGLYASFIPPLIYCFFGTSRHLSLGTFSIMSILASSTAIREGMLLAQTMTNETANSSGTMSENLEMSKLQISIITTLVAGIIQFLMGVCRMGGLMNYVSDSLIEGFTTATAIHVMVSQLDQILGYDIESYSGIGELPYKMFLFAMKIREIQWITFGVSFGSILFLFLFSIYVEPAFQKKFNTSFPIQFVIVVLSTVISYFCSASTNFSMNIVGHVPKGLPEFMLPNVTFLPKIFVDATVLAVVGFIMNSALVKVYAIKFSYDVNYNQELVAYGLSNLCGSFFQCTISAGALARTTVVVQAGMKSQIASLVSCIFMVFVLLFIGPLFQHTPNCVLSAMIIISLKSILLQFKNLPSLYTTSKYDFHVWIVTILATIFLNVPIGLTVGFIFSLITIVIRLQNPKVEMLGQLPNTDIYKNIKYYKDAKEVSGIKIYRYEAPLYFANAESFKTKLYRKTKLKYQLRSIMENKKESSDIKENGNGKVSSSEEICKQYPVTDILPVEVDLMDKIELEKKLYIDSGIGSMATTQSTTTIENNNNVARSTSLETVKSECTVLCMGEESVITKYLILDFSSINYVDNVAIRVLNTIEAELQSCGIGLKIAGPNSNTRNMFQRSNFVQERLQDMMFLTVHDAVLSIKEEESLSSHD